MGNMKSAIRRLALAATALTAVSATAGIKYWDNPDYRAFDVDCYVPGAVWNYDGIRNAGAAADHDSTALTWANLGSFGSANDAVLQKSASDWPAVSSAELSAGTYGEWTDKGFVFKGNSRFRRASPGKIQVGTSYTIQFLVDATSAAQVKNTGFLFAVQYEQFAMNISRSDGRFYWRTAMANSASKDYSFLDGGTFDYGTAIVDGTANTTAFFSGTKAPTSGDGFRQYASVVGRDEAGYAIGCTSGTGNEFTGTMKFLRVYNHALSEEEVAWNRVVDERRFFNRAAPLPVTNVVVATAVAGAYGEEPNGCYAVDGRHVFTAPRVATVDNAKFICTGYTLEPWDSEASDWGTAVFHARELSCKVEDSDRVRITWKWMDGEGIKTYDVSDYVWDGLEVFYDGICNQGVNVAHSTTALTWKNLGSKGATNDLFLQLLNAAGNGWSTATSLDAVGERNPGAWTDNGFTLVGDSRFRIVNTNGTNGGIQTGTGYSLQTLVDAKTADQNEAASFVFSLSAAKYSMILYKSGRFDWRSDDAPDSGTPLKMSGTSFDYATAIANGTDNTLALFSGTEIPTSGDGFRQLESITAHNLERGYDLGGYGNANYDKLLVGTIKSFRQYDHALSAAEVAQNRKVDDFRFFGKFAETDVIVQSTYAALQGNEPDGEYDIDGSHTFTAPANVTIKVNGKEIEYACAGYTVETWGPLANKGDGWSAATHYTGTSYAYSETAGKVRLTWKWKATRGLRTAADYGFDDYSQAGIVWNFDGIYNQGVGVERSTTATTWKNLAPNPVTGQIFIQRLNSNANGYANNDSTILGSLIATDGNWTENDKGFTMKGASRWRGLGQVGPVANWTIQSLIDADVNDIADDIGYVVSASWSNFATVLRKTGNGPVPNSFHFNAQDAQNVNTRPYFQNESGKYGFATAILDSSDRTSKMFQGVTPPTSGTIADGYHQYASAITPFKDTNFGIGAPAGSYTQFFIGTLKSIRYYDRVLTEEELVRNRNVDAVRYFGALGVTNVVVGTEAYKVEGSWTFTAPPTVDGKKVTGYRLEILENGEWVRKPFCRETSFTYSEDAEEIGGKTVRLEWAPEPPGLMIIVK